MPTTSITAVEITVPAEPAAVHILRSMAQAVASGELDIDRLDDLSLAVGEAAVELLGAGNGARLAMTVDRVGSGLDLRLTVDGSHPVDWPARWESSLSASVLAALADEVTAETTSDGPGVRFAFADRSPRRQARQL